MPKTGSQQAKSPATTPAPTPPVMSEAKKPPLGLQGWVQVLAALSAVLVVLTPVIYFNGRAFHDGWYDHFHLDPSMFPLDTAGMLTEGAIAWGDGLAAIVSAVTHVSVWIWLRVASVLLGGALLGAGFVWIHKLLETKRNKKSAPKRWPKIGELGKQLLSTLLVMGVSAAAIYVLVFGLIFVMALLSAPFYELGKHQASLAAQGNFSDRPTITAKISTTEHVKRQEMECGTQFCALWGEGHASVAPVSAIEWGDAPPPDK